MKPRLHIFVCQNQRPVGSRPACGGRGSHDIARALSEALAKRPELWGEVQVTGCECLGPCFDGPNLVVYPAGTWYSGVTLGDVDDLADALAEGRTLDRLAAPDDDA